MILTVIREKIELVKEAFVLGYRQSMVKQVVAGINKKLNITVPVVIEHGIGGAFYDANNHKVLLDPCILQYLQETKYDLRVIKALLKKHNIKNPNSKITILTFLYLHEVGHAHTCTLEMVKAESTQREQLTSMVYNATDESSLMDGAYAYRKLPLEELADMWAINTLKNNNLL